MEMKTLLATGLILACAPSLWAQQWDSGDPTTAEQLALEIINRARANPVAEGNRLSAANELADASLTNHLVVGFPPGSGQAGDVTEGLVSPNNIVAARPPLAMNKILLGTARAHNDDMYLHDIFQHNSFTGVDPGTRMTSAGYGWAAGGSWGENIAYAGSSFGGTNANSAQLENILMIDHNQLPNRGHRVNLLDTHAAPFFREIGVAYLHHDAPTATLDMTDVMTQDFGRIDTQGPFVLGVVYNDVNSNGFYDLNEGMAGVTVKVTSAPGVFAITGAAGGFAFPANTSAGAITIQATGGVFGVTGVSKTLSPNFPGENFKVDFKASEAAAFADTDADGLPDSWETANFGNLSQTGAGDFDGDGATNLAEFNAGTDPKDPLSKPGGGAPPPSTKKGGGGGGCGLTGLEAVVLLLALRRRRSVAK